MKARMKKYSHYVDNGHINPKFQLYEWSTEPNLPIRTEISRNTDYMCDE